MKKLTATLLFVFATVLMLHAQKPTREKITKSDLPQPVKEGYENSIGFPVQEWIKLTLNNGPRFIAVTQQMNSSSGETLQYRYRYNGEGKMTSTSHYRGAGKGKGSDFFTTYLGTGGTDAAFEKKVAQLVKDNDVVSFEAFDFVPGNEFDKLITTHRFVLKDKKGKVSVVYFDHDGKEVDLAKYPVRKLEAEELD